VDLPAFDRIQTLRAGCSASAACARDLLLPALAVAFDASRARKLDAILGLQLDAHVDALEAGRVEQGAERVRSGTGSGPPAREHDPAARCRPLLGHVGDRWRMPPDSGQRPAANTLSGVPDDCHELDIVTPSAAAGRRSARESVGVGRVLPLSVLDVAPIVAGGTPGESLRNSLDLARQAERLGYTRYWVAEHHNLSGIASAATAVVIAHLAQSTTRIRVGAGGVMLPNHAPLVIAEQFGTLEALHPGRIDLGLGRAPGTDRVTLRALRGGPSADTFPQDVLELQALLGDPQPGQAVFAIPGVGSHVPLWILGSSLYGAQLAAALGLPYAFASHFAPDALLPALALYRERFQPSAQLQRPYAMVAVNVIAADDDEAARLLFTSAQQAFTNVFRGARGQLPPPIADIETFWSPDERAGVSNMLSRSYVGSPATVREGLEVMIAETEADELIVASAIHDHAARVRSYEILAEVRPLARRPEVAARGGTG